MFSLPTPLVFIAALILVSSAIGLLWDLRDRERTHPPS